MRGLLLALLVGLASVVALGVERPDWAFPVAGKVQPPTKQNDQPKTVAGSLKSHTQAQIDNLKNPPDWFPNMHPPMPQVVAQGAKTFACASCHLPIGTGHDASVIWQGCPLLTLSDKWPISKTTPEKDLVTCPTSLKLLVTGTSDLPLHTLPCSPLGPGSAWWRPTWCLRLTSTRVTCRLALPRGVKEPIGNRIVELPETEEAAVERDPRPGFIVYAPIGSITKGKRLVTSGGDGKTTPCGTCHGPTLLGQVSRRRLPAATATMWSANSTFSRW